MIRRGRWAMVLLVPILAGCGRAPVQKPVGTGARDAVRTYCEALWRGKWSQAYATLHPDDQQRCPADEFAWLAQAYRDHIGFDPDELKIGVCEEKGSEAIAHIAFVGRVSGMRRRYKDAFVLRQSAGVWRVVLPDNFGKPTP